MTNAPTAETSTKSFTDLELRQFVERRINEGQESRVDLANQLSQHDHWTAQNAIETYAESMMIDTYTEALLSEIDLASKRTINPEPLRPNLERLRDRLQRELTDNFYSHAPAGFPTVVLDAKRRAASILYRDLERLLATE